VSPTLVFLNGFTGTPASWDRVRGRIGHVAPVLAPPLLGHGAPPPFARTFDEEVDRLAALVRDAGPAPAHVVGYSLGARLGLGLLARHPRLFASATLVAPHPGLTTEQERRARIAEDAARAARLREGGLDAFVAEWEAMPLFATQRSLPPAELEAQRAHRRGHDAEGLALSLEVLGLGRMPPRWDLGPTLTVPVHLLVGGADAKFEALARRFAQGAPRVRVDVVADAGHNLPLEAPAAVATSVLHALDPGENP